MALLARSGDSEATICGTVADAIGASLRPGSTTDRLAAADSLMLHKTWHTPSGRANPHWNHDLAIAFARHGDYRSAAAAARRRLAGRRIRVAVSLRDEGRWSLMSGDTTHAIAAFQAYLKLRDNPEPALVPERDSIRAQLAAISPPTRRRSSR